MLRDYGYYYKKYPISLLTAFGMLSDRLTYNVDPPAPAQQKQATSHITLAEALLVAEKDDVLRSRNSSSEHITQVPSIQIIRLGSTWKRNGLNMGLPKKGTPGQNHHGSQGKHESQWPQVFLYITRGRGCIHIYG